MEEWWSGDAPLARLEPRPPRVGSPEQPEISSISNGSMSPSRHNLLLFSASFCTPDNVASCMTHVNQELSSLGLSSSSCCMEASRPGGAGLEPVSALNAVHQLLRLHRRLMASLEELEREQLKRSSALEHLHCSNSRLKDQLEVSLREKSGLHELERQLQLKIKTLQSCLKSEKDEVQKLQSIISRRASQYSHDAKRKEREAAKLKDRLSQLLVDRRDKKLAIEMLNCPGRPDGRRSHWKTAKTTLSHEGEMYRSLLSDYEARQTALMLENSELKKVLQQMKKEMIHILSPRQNPDRDDSQEQGRESDGEDQPADCSRDAPEQSCDHAREQLTNSIRQQWRRVRKHVEKLDSQVSQVQSRTESREEEEEEEEEEVPRQTQQDEMEKMKQEVQQCKEFIHAQQLLLQQQLNASLDDDAASFLHDCYTLEDRERLKEEWRMFQEQKRNFECERRNFTEAAIRLGREKRAFEEDRASWLKNQFLNMTPFAERRRCSSSDAQSAFSIRSEPEIRMSPGKPSWTKSSRLTPSQSAAVLSLSPADSCRTVRLTPDSSSSRPSSRGRWQVSGSAEDMDALLKSKSRVQHSNLSIFSLDGDENPPPLPL